MAVMIEAPFCFRLNVSSIQKEHMSIAP